MKKVTSSTYRYAFIALSTLGVAFLFNSCADAVFSSRGLTKLAPPEVILEILKNCKEAETAGKLLTAQQAIVFEDSGVESGRPGNICEFGKDDNLSEKDGELRARYTQTKSVTLPPGAVLCDVKMQTTVQNFRYDDVFFLTFNGNLLASNDKTAVSQRLDQTMLTLPVSNIEVGVYEYDWLKVRTAAFQNEVVDDYCLGSNIGQATCSWPLTEQSGNIQLNFSQELLIGMSAQQSSQNLQFVITGDNDPKVDCFHQKFQLDATVKYFLP